MSHAENCAMPRLSATPPLTPHPSRAQPRAPIARATIRAARAKHCHDTRRTRARRNGDSSSGAVAPTGLATLARPRKSATVAHSAVGRPRTRTRSLPSKATPGSNAPYTQTSRVEVAADQSRRKCSQLLQDTKRNDTGATSDHFDDTRSLRQGGFSPNPRLRVGR